jgi:hypothetical protein
MGLSLYTQGGNTYFLESYDVGKIFTLALLIILCAMVSFALFLACVILYSIGHLQGIKLPLIFICLSIALSLLGPLVLMFGLPPAIGSTLWDEDDVQMTEFLDPKTDNPSTTFFGTVNRHDDYFSEELDEELTWGPDYGWFLPFVSTILASVCFILLILARKKKQSTDNALYSLDAEPQEPYRHDFGQRYDPGPEKEPDEDKERILYERLKEKYEGSVTRKEQRDATKTELLHQDEDHSPRSCKGSKGKKGSHNELNVKKGREKRDSEEKIRMPQKDPEWSDEDDEDWDDFDDDVEWGDDE